MGCRFSPQGDDGFQRLPQGTDGTHGAALQHVQLHLFLLEFGMQAFGLLIEGIGGDERSQVRAQGFGQFEGSVKADEEVAQEAVDGLRRGCRAEVGLVFLQIGLQSAHFVFEARAGGFEFDRIEAGIHVAEVPTRGKQFVGHGECSWGR